MSVLLETTNMILSQAALLLNKSVNLSSSTTKKSAHIPAAIQRSNQHLARSAKKLLIQSTNPLFSKAVVEKARAKYKDQKSHHQQLIRKRRMLESNKRDAKTFSVCSSDPSKLFKAVRSARKNSDIVVKKIDCERLGL